MSQPTPGSRRWPAWLQRILFGVASILVVSMGLMVATEAAASTITHYSYWREMLVSSPIVSLLGAVILVHRRKHPIGLVLLLSGVANAVALLGGTVSVAASALGWPLVQAGAWVANLLREAGFILAFGLLFLLYPTGAPLGRIGRWMVMAVTVAVALSAFAKAFRPGPLSDFPQLSNPVAVELGANLFDSLHAAANLIVVGIGLAGGLATIAIRLFRSEGVEHLQIRAFFYAAIVAISGLTMSGMVLSEEVQARADPFLWTLFPMLVVAAMAMAIARYRLYDIDRLISRTILYGLLSGVLAGLYVALVFVIGAVTPIEGQFPVAASTLAVAATFNPLRRRIQSAVDRRFNRSRYDAAATIEGFSRRLRTDVDLRGVVEALKATATATMDPEWLAIWLRRDGEA